MMDTQGGTPRNSGPGLYEFLMEAELQHYYAGIKGDLKVQTAAQLKYVTEEDLNVIGMSKPEMRRLRKYFHKHFPQNYLSKFKRLLLPKRDEQPPGVLAISTDGKSDKLSIKVPNKHMIPTDAIIVNKELGIGEFGIVQQGVWTNDGERIQVAIKCLSRERMQNNPIEFLKEAAIMHSIDHENIVRLYGVVLDTDSLMLVTELAPLRSLLECLKEPGLRANFPILSLCDFTIQIAHGMQYLEAKRLIHRDLAARNILVFSKNKVKISDFGLSRALGVGKDYYQTNFNVNLKLPIAWCAPECISYLKFTSSSDVWAYGVTLWEMFSYGFQPWAALTGHQILEAIDEPNFQRLEQPECCPEDYFSLMQQCWQHEPAKRPKFSELVQLLPELRPEQVQAVQDNIELGQLFYRQGDIITVLDKGVNNVFWKGVLSNGKTGIFNPAHTITYLGSNLPGNKPGEFIRGDGKSAFSSQRRKIRMDMISSPQGDFKHTGHVGLDGAYFGDISFLGGKYPHVPRQIVTPYKPQEDITDQMMHRNSAQDPKNPESCCDCSSFNCNAHASQDGQYKHDNLWTDTTVAVPTQDTFSDPDVQTVPDKIGISENSDHEYHEISDEENQNNVLRFDKPLDFDFGPSLLDEMDQMFRSLGTSTSASPPERMTSTDHESSNVKNEMREIQAKQGNKKKQATVKPISAADQRTLYSAIAMAQELTARSMTDLEYPAEPPQTPASPTRRKKFSFKLPHQHSPKPDKRHFSEEAASIPDIQATLSDEAKEVYNSLVDTQMKDSSNETNPLRMLRLGMPIVKSRVRGTKYPNPGNMTSETNGMTDFSDNRLSFDQHHIDTQYLHKLHNMSTFSQPIRVSPIHTLERHKSLLGIENDPVHRYADENPIPLPPRDRSKTLQPKSNLPRHQRKHPLIIPGNGVSRTLAKMGMCSTGDQVDGNISFGEPNLKAATAINDMEMCTPDMTPNSPEDFEQRLDLELAALDALPLSNNQVASDLLDFSENLVDCTMDDTRFMIFPNEISGSSQLSVDKVVGGDMCDKPLLSNPHKLDQCRVQLPEFERTQKQEISPNNIDYSTTKSSDMCQTMRPYNNPAVLVDGSKVDENVDPDAISHRKHVTREHDLIPTETSNSYIISDKQTPISDLSRHSDHVSCEDLLEFACDGPNIHRTRGPHNGKQSDEVRIMLKVLHGHSTPDSCLAALNSTHWDILAAIKLERLHELLGRENHTMSVDDCKEILDECNGDVSKAAALLRNTDNNASI